MDKTSRKNFYKLFFNKYIIAVFLFIVWIIFFDENSIVIHMKNKERLNELRIQKEYYIERISSDTKKLEELNAGKEGLEKFAREQFYMSKPGEDVFIIIEQE